MERRDQIRCAVLTSGHVCCFQKTIPRTKRQLIHRITELGRLYRRIDEFVQKKNAQPDAGLSMQVSDPRGIYEHL